MTDRAQPAGFPSAEIPSMGRQGAGWLDSGRRGGPQGSMSRDVAGHGNAYRDATGQNNGNQAGISQGVMRRNGEAGTHIWWTDALSDPWRDPTSQARVVYPPAFDPRPALEPLDKLVPDSGTSGRRLGGGLWLVVLVTALLAGALGGALGYVAAVRTDSGNEIGGEVPAAAERPPDSVAGVVNQVLPSVVTIEFRSGTHSGNGSGFVISTDGYIMTNEHVAEAAGNAGEIRVVFSDGSATTAQIVGGDNDSDVAVLRVDRENLSPVQFGDSTRVAVGDPVIAIGAPLGLQNTVTTGVISALDRPVVAGEEDNYSVVAAIQTDAAINPGNSGGPLLDASGRVIGVNSAIQTLASEQGQAGNIGLGFAIPINHARRIANEIIQNGSATRTVIGAELDMSYDNINGGVRLQAVEPGGPAERAGLRGGDIVTRFGERYLQEGVELLALVRTHAPGDVVTVEYLRGTERRTTQVTLAADAE